jgi:hypothetical protein
MKANIMQIGVPYLVTRSGDNGDLEEGLHIMFNTPELLVCMETQGYINDRAEINELLRGAEVTPDLVGIKHMKAIHLEAIKNLSGFPEPSEEDWEASNNQFTPSPSNEEIRAEIGEIIDTLVAEAEAKDATIN